MGERIFNRILFAIYVVGCFGTVALLYRDGRNPPSFGVTVMALGWPIVVPAVVILVAIDKD